MNIRNLSGRAMLTLLLGLGLGCATEVWAQRTGGGGGGRGGGGGGGLGGGGGGTRTSGTRTYYPNGVIGDAMISVDPETHRIIAITDDDTAKAIEQVITNLDRPTPQVFIKVVFLEVTHNQGSDIGVEGSWTKRISNTVTGTVSTAFGAAQMLNGAMYKVLSDNFNATMAALATAGKTEVLSRPSILARNNQLATITVGQSIPLITGTQITTLGNQINSIAYQDIGIILRVTPFITADGLVQMIISPEISSLTDQTVPIASNVSAPVIAKRSADTVVVTPDGEPVVIGGLMQNQKIDSVQKVPILGDIPLLGLAFKRRTQSYQKTELVIILIPHIVGTPKQLAAVSARERSQTEMSQKAFSERDLDRFIDGLPVKKDTVPNASPTTSQNKKIRTPTMGKQSY